MYGPIFFFGDFLILGCLENDFVLSREKEGSFIHVWINIWNYILISYL